MLLESHWCEAEWLSSTVIHASKVVKVAVKEFTVGVMQSSGSHQYYICRTRL